MPLTRRQRKAANTAQLRDRERQKAARRRRLRGPAWIVYLDYQAFYGVDSRTRLFLGRARADELIPSGGSPIDYGLDDPKGRAWFWSPRHEDAYEFPDKAEAAAMYLVAEELGSGSYGILRLR